MMEEGTLPHATPHGQKRQSDDELDHEQRLSKRFNLLNLEQNGKLYIPVKSQSMSTAPPSPPRRRRSNAVSEAMPVEDTKDRVYIHNLDEELADIESDEEKLIFLPDIEKRLMRIPRALLTGEEPPQHNELILYKAPGSISLPEERDVVRKPIAEARARASERHHESLLETNTTQPVKDSASDAMELG